MRGISYPVLLRAEMQSSASSVNMKDIITGVKASPPDPSISLCNQTFIDWSDLSIQKDGCSKKTCPFLHRLSEFLAATCTQKCRSFDPNGEIEFVLNERYVYMKTSDIYDSKAATLWIEQPAVKFRPIVCTAWLQYQGRCPYWFSCVYLHPDLNTIKQFFCQSLSRSGNSFA